MKNSFNLLITRPAHQAKPLREQLAQHGIASSLLPMLEIERCAYHIDGEFDIIIATSANAIVPTPHASTYLAIGPGTQAAWSVPSQTPTIFSSKGLLSMPVLQTVQDKHILILTGQNARPLLAETLTKHGANVTCAETYRRRYPDYTPDVIATVTQKIDGVIFTSIGSLENGLRLLGKAWLRTQIVFVVSEKMRTRLASHGISCYQAGNATDAAIVDAVLRLSF